MTENAGTAEVTEEAQVDEGTSPATPETPAEPDVVTTLRSRNAGLDRTVTKLTAEKSEAEARALEAERRYTELMEGKASSDEEIKAMLEQFKSAAETAKAEAKAAKLAAKYPESYLELGDAISNFDEAKLESIEFRLSGVAAPQDETPERPVGNAQKRVPSEAPVNPSDLSVEDYKGWFKKQFGHLTGEDLVQTTE